MADIPEAPKENTDDQVSEHSTNDSTDQDFDITADMMVHDIDDETTLEEEELNEDKENIEDEIAELEKEGDMPIEALLAMYGYAGDPSERSHPVPLEDIQPEPLPPLVSASGESHEQDVTPNQYEAKADNHNNLPSTEEDDDSSVPSPAAQDQSDYAPSPSANKNDNMFPENQRITRGILAAYSYFNLGESSSSDDDDNEYNPEEWKKEIRIGPDHQAEVPSSMCTDKEYHYDGQDKCLWNPTKISEKELQSYLNMISQPVDGEAITRDVLRDDEQALYLLLQCNYDVKEALNKKHSQTNPRAEMALWSEEECRDFESGLRMFGKEFRQIQQNKVTSRSVGEIVQFYYLWKKTERHDAFACQSRLSKKKYSFHPGITDYMDRFLDDNESAASSRASSPHNFPARSRVGNGYLQSQVSSHNSMSVSQPDVHSVPSGSHHTTVSMMSTLRPSHHPPREPYGTTHQSPGQPPQLLQSCVPTSVIVSSQERHEISPKRPRLEHDNMPRLISSAISRPPPLKPIFSVSNPLPQKSTSSELPSHMGGTSSSVHIPQNSTSNIPESLQRVSGADIFPKKY
ncbi:mesoderm induction early response protein 1-like [Actinia tenebrosa]|uniref:Mesoderm induction early response protein 1-like n=1 Tax=Actinia tenebrosa TaxID=6105 RepID=A0A6P8I6X3_ACTTE|nr:mesoderm induction early response protein 1-like [Actinia tenebrosa]